MIVHNRLIILSLQRFLTILTFLVLLTAPASAHTGPAEVVAVGLGGVLLVCLAAGFLMVHRLLRIRREQGWLIDALSDPRVVDAPLPTRRFRCAQSRQLARRLRLLCRNRTERNERLASDDHDRDLVLGSISEMVVFQDTHFRIRWCNDAAADFYGRPREELIGRPSYKIWSRLGQGPSHCPAIQSLATGRRDENELTTRDGRTWLIRANPVFDASGQPVGVVEVASDITQLKRIEQSLRQSESRYRAVVEDQVELIARFDDAGVLNFANRSFRTFFALPETETLGRCVFDLFPPDQRGDLVDQAARLSADQQASAREVRFHRAGQPEQVVHWTVRAILDDAQAIVEYQAVGRDITALKAVEDERRKLNERIAHAQKLESLGVLAGGIAHDFNNLLTGIVGNADLAMLESSSTEPKHEYLDNIKRITRRASALTAQMLAYSGQGTFQVQPVDVNELVADLGDLLGASISKKASLDLDLTRNLPPVQADPAQLQQVVMNLIVNASDALNGQAGRIDVRTSLRELDAQTLREHYLGEDLPAGNYLCLDVLDTGCGMDEATRARLFDPFFTTKRTGRGLGMSAVLGIVRGHHGAIRVDSTPGQGTHFTLLLPALNQPAVPSEETPSGQFVTDVPPETPAGGTILLADDEQSILKLVSLMLKRQGFEVLTAANGRECIDLFAEHHHRIDAVLLDMSMPEMDGLETFDRLQDINPSRPVVLCSGYDAGELKTQCGGRGLAGFVKKPFDLGDLRQALQTCRRQCSSAVS